MQINSGKFLSAVNSIAELSKHKELKRISLQKEFSSETVDKTIEILCKLLKNGEFVEEIRNSFSFILLLIVTKFLEDLPDEGYEIYQKKCIALSKLVYFNPQVLKYTVHYFTIKKQPPFLKDTEQEVTPKKRFKKSSEISDLEIVECCLNFLNSDLSFYRQIWNWDKFIELYWNQGCEIQKFYTNQIIGLLFGMNHADLRKFNQKISPVIQIEHSRDHLSRDQTFQINENGKQFEWNFRSDVVINIEDVFLSIFDKENVNFYRTYNSQYDSLVKVDSTKINLRSLALGISSGKAICLSGPVGCGKTSLVEYLARQTGRLAPKIREFQKYLKDNNCYKENGSKILNKNKRKQSECLDDSNNENLIENIKKITPKSGFLRIQLGDQTDSKVLLGQYRCTDIAGEFIWQPGVLTQAVLNGQWLLLEDLDSATQDVCTVLTNLLENNSLNVPGFRENLKIAPGFQLFVTLRTQKSMNPSHNSAYSLLEKYLYIINVLPLSRNELSEIICANFPKLTTVSKRIVDVFLTFSSGCHSLIDEISNIDSILQETNTSLNENGISEPLVSKHSESTTGLPNSGRMVSTRDLLKLCKRSNPSFSVTSTECAYFVFQNCVDLFCSHLPQGKLKTNLIINIGAKLGIIESRCLHLADEYKPVVTVNSDEIKIGRVTLDRNSKEIFDRAEKRLKVDEDYKSNGKKNAIPTFSFTRIASCILERIAVAVDQNEPILLVGETGVGKTSSIQYLAHQTNHKLVVVNMNNQSDVSDLIGGFKPVDIAYVITPLRLEFETLFGKTFDQNKNEKFLTNISVCFNRGDFGVLIKLMLKVIESVYKKISQQNIIERWQLLETKLQKMDHQLKTSINLSFAFIPGSLVNCIKNGDWVLLDEINLASTETLECLSTILEPDGSVILLERGDFMPVKRHPDFRIFSCMNPNTDVGKKDLPVGIRNRFTEFFVDELIAENDLLILIGDYLNATGIQKSKIFNSVKLYMNLRNLSQLELNDGLGNKPVFSLRTLCRALRICAKNLCGSVERNLYESFCLSFLTQLDLESHIIVEKLIQKSLLSDTKKVLSQQIPRPEGNQINFEGYWIEKGAREVQECKEYILTGSVRKNLKDLARIISIGRLPILLQGPTSAGKTSMIEYIAKKSGNYCMRINNHEHTDLQEYIGTYMADVSGKLAFKEGVLVQAMRNGYWIILDELNLAPSDILEALNRVLDDNRELYIPETQTVIKAHPNFMLFATQNPPGLYGGRKTLSRAFKNRFIELHFSDIPKAELEEILEKRCLIPKSYAQKMVKTMSVLQINRRTTTKNNFTLRDLFRWGNRYTFADKNLLNERSYDWNQHLVDEGFLVLSAKNRNQFENDIIMEALFQNFRKKIELNNLFTLHEKSSLVTRHILEKLDKYKGEQNVVWTLESRRMAILAAKAMEFNEPILLVGPTGCGKTTICQILAEIAGKTLRILNCHMHTEGADFLGGLRPFRDNSEKKTNQKQLFEWADGPLILSMSEGSFFMADEISLAEDSVLERLNCVLESERTILLAEKGGVDANITQESSEFVIKANDGFQFMATMNPGGDFGKKELSPALRNRFTEIWCTAINNDEDLRKIAKNSLESGFWKDQDNISPDNIGKVEQIAYIIVSTVKVLKEHVEKLNFSIRDVLAWGNYIVKNYGINEESNSTLKLEEALYFGLQTLFLDSLEMLLENYNDVVAIKNLTIQKMEKDIKELLNIDCDYKAIADKLNQPLVNEFTSGKFGIDPFYLNINSLGIIKANDFSFSAPTTKKNLFRVLSALTLNKAILLEGPPGVGKTSLIENIANAIGYDIVRINLCEHTDLADLFGTDLPADDKALETKENLQLGSFIWRDGPLLAALKAKNTWILLDELNLAPQSVLEGLNAILDHRGEVYIPELNKTFKLGQQTKIFAAQNPLRQGGGRKGLPQSFLNRFTKVYLRKLEKSDLLHVIRHNFGNHLECLQNYNLLEKMVEFSEKLETGIANLEFGYKGGPFEANLRDILRWCMFLTNNKTGFDLTNFQPENPQLMTDFILTLFEKMKLVYMQRMRTEADKVFILNAFSCVFNCNAFELNEKSKNVGLYWDDETVYISDIVHTKESKGDLPELPHFQQKHAILLNTQLELLKNVTECVLLEKPIIVCGSSDSGKTKIIDTFCSIFNKNLYSDTIDDSVTGSFQQFDFNRWLEEISQSIEAILFDILTKIAINVDEKAGNKEAIIQMVRLWFDYNSSMDQKDAFQQSSSSSDELNHFCDHINALDKVVNQIQNYLKTKTINYDLVFEKFDKLKSISMNTAMVLNSGGRFEWVDSVIVKSIKFGNFIRLEHVNLASSAVLDRLNPVLEPQGVLMISEKGVGANNDPEIVQKHKNFRIFMTLDPKHGEISRAMRNRCIELAIPKDYFTENDLRKIVYSEGVHQMYLIKAIIQIHHAVCNVSEYSNFGIAHLIKFAFLVAQNEMLEIQDDKCLLMASLEVYVRSTNTDLLGFGLNYYKAKLKETILENIRCVKKSDNIVNYENIILKSDKLTTLNLVKLQCEPISVVLKTVDLNSDEIREYLSDINTLFADIEVKNPKETVKYLLWFLFQISSFADIDTRVLYLKELLNGDLNEMCKNMKNTLAKMRPTENKLKFLPWNSKMFPRIKIYQTAKLAESVEYRISLLLLLNISLDKIEVKNTVKLNEIDAITYSKAIQKKAITDIVDNVLITSLYDLMLNFEDFLRNNLENMTEFTKEDFAKCTTSYLWINRLMKIAKEKLFVRKNLDEDLIRNLKLHFKWFNKHCVEFFVKYSASPQNQFLKSYNAIQNYILSSYHPLNLPRKIYFKNFVNNLPFYENHQVEYYSKLKQINEMMSVVPTMDQLFDFEDFQKRLVLMNQIKYQDFKKFLVNNTEFVLNKYFEIFAMENHSVSTLTDAENFNYVLHEIDENLVHFEKINGKFDNNLKFTIELLPILEYYMLRTFTGLQSNVAMRYENNEDYFLQINSLNADVLELIQLVNHKSYHQLKDRSVLFKEDFSNDFYRKYTTLQKTIRKQIQKFSMNSLAVNSNFCHYYEDEANYQNAKDNTLFTNSPLLLNTMLPLLIPKNGEIRGIGLGEISDWRSTLHKLKQILWINAEISSQEFDFLKNSLETHRTTSRQILKEVKFVQELCSVLENENFSDFNKDFQSLIDLLEIEVNRENSVRDVMWQNSYLLNALSGIVELNIISYLPLIDPVMKNQLKTLYLSEDISHLENILLANKFMEITMEYTDLGKENCELFQDKIEELRAKMLKHSKKVAIRPERCVYGNLVKDINHFLISCCHPQAMKELLQNIKKIFAFQIDYSNITRNLETRNVLVTIDELINKLDLWISNSNQFEHHTLKKYDCYYRDFVAPIESTITNVRYGFTGLKSILNSKKCAIQQKSNDAYYNLNENNEISTLMKNLIEFPSIHEVEVVDSQKTLHHVNVFTMLEKVSHSESLYFKLVRSRIQELMNMKKIGGGLSESIFLHFDAILNICNQLWQKQEEVRRKKQDEEDSLYITKTKCEEEDEETVKLKEIQEIFPNYAEEDFNEFLQNDTLEQVIKFDKVKKAKQLNEIIDYKFIGDYFMDLMCRKTAENREFNYLDVFDNKQKVFCELFNNFKACLDSELDDKAYRSLCLIIKLCQESYDSVDQQETRKSYNFYKDSNIPEATQCIEILNQLEKRVLVELEQWPDHAVLEDLIRIINRIRGFPSNSPLARFNTGLQILREKVDQWNSVAHRLNNFKDVEAEIVVLIQRWMRMELQCWRESMDQSLESVRSKAYRYWFFLYNLIHEYISGSDKTSQSNLLDFQKVEKRFAEDEIIEDKTETTNMSLEAVTNVLKQFIESSNYAEFELRMKLLKSFEYYLEQLGCETKKIQLRSVLFNIHMYYSQFAEKVAAQINFVRSPVEKKLKEFVKIESFNKDLSYFSMRNNINRVHRQLHKFLKEFENEIRIKIVDLFKFKDSNAEIMNINADSTNKYYGFVEIEEFIAPSNIVTKYTLNQEATTSELLIKSDKYFQQSRKIIKKAILEASYPSLIYSFTRMMEDQLETCNHLRCLEVDRSQPKNKQKSQAKSILNQKRKALSDFFKLLNSLGISFKTGLLLNSLNPDHIDLTIEVFQADHSLSENMKVKHHVGILNEKLDLYYSKSIFKLKLLKNALLIPTPDIDHSNLERIKGFSIDLFLLVQKQRVNLAENVNNLKVLKKSIRDLNNIENTSASTNFKNNSQMLHLVENCLVKIVNVFEQFEILLKCAPTECDCQLLAIKSTNNKFTQNNPLLQIISKNVGDILCDSRNQIAEISTENQLKFKPTQKIHEYHTKFLQTYSKIQQLKEMFAISNEYSVFAQPILDLIIILNENLKSYEALDRIEENGLEDDSLDQEIENVMHTILLAIQNIYKKFMSLKTIDQDEKKAKRENHVENQEEVDDNDYDLMSNHLKEEMTNELHKDIELLNLRKVNLAINRIFERIFEQTSQNTIKILSMIPILHQYELLTEYYLVQQLGVHKLSTKMLSLMLSVFLELSTKGFCVPQDLLAEEEDGKQENDGKTGEGFGFEDGEGEKDVSEKLESEDQLEEARKPEDYNDQEKNDKDCKEEKGIDMTEDFEGKMQDVPEDGDESDDNDESKDEELDKEMGETADGADKLDDQIWGSDEENEEEEEEENKDKKDEDGKGSGEKDDKHNDLGVDKDNLNAGEEEEGLDAADGNEDNKQKKKEQQKDIDHMDEQGDEEEQINPYHNELEEPPEPEDFDMGDVNLDNDDNQDKQENNKENPMDIDKMKENMETADDENLDKGDDENQENKENKEDDLDTSDDEDQDGTEKIDENNPEDQNEAQDNENTVNDEKEEEDIVQKPDNIENDDEKQDKENHNDNTEDYHESKDKKSKEENLQAMPKQQQKGSKDEVQVENTEESANQENEMDDQDTGEDKDGVGQAENEKSKSGHQGVAETKETRSKENNEASEKQQKRKKGNTDEDRTLGEVEKMEKKSLKTVDKLNRKENENDENETEMENEADEYQHVKDAKKTDKTTLDNATEEQSKKIKHDDKDITDNTEEDEESHEQLPETEDEEMPNDEKIQQMESMKLDQKSDKPSKSEEKTNEVCENKEDVEVEGETIGTYSVARGDETTAHYQLEILNDITAPIDPTDQEALEMRKRVESELTSTNRINANASDMDSWQGISNKMMSNARELCEQLRLILEPTKCTRLKGDYRTGRRINMKKIIPYIASQFRKDKIWLRRTKAAQRDYKISIAVDDSKSMDHNNSKTLTLEAISLVSQALTLLESGKLNVLSFGEKPTIILKYNEQFNGPNLINALNFDQNHSKIAELLDFIRTLNQDDPSTDNGIFENLLIVLSDGRNIFSEGEQKVKNAVKLARLQRIFIVYIIIDNPENKHSILDIRVPQFSNDKKTITMHSYLDNFPFPYYIIVRDLGQLPIVLSEAMRQWFELVNSEQ